MHFAPEHSWPTFGAAQPPKRSRSPGPADPAAAAAGDPKRRAVRRGPAPAATVLGKRRDSAADQPAADRCAKRARVAGAGQLEEEEEESESEDAGGPFARLSVIKMPLALRAQAFLADPQHRDDRRRDTAEPPPHRAAAAAAAPANDALVLYRPPIQLGDSGAALVPDDAMSIDE
ncbi:hypothetical protein IWQ57_000463 [Coemansia nantahalensis]|uniref:Uncharacterized protein n=1 Tax=Coemansia nantahalensis TaxID=2789366 RepID=A0ACC1K8J7_9FUNG|nr:hypothetical protein IWQ57_000463 [Coemansia nantahalensis]